MVLLLPVLVAIAALPLGLTIAAPQEYYATKYDHINVDTILNNRRMVNYYVECMLSKGPCPPEGVEFKRILPEALQTNCLRCTEKQRTVTLRAIKRLKKEYPKVWAQLEEAWDPDGSYIKRFEATFDTRRPEATPEASVQIQNRFGDDQNTDKRADNSIDQISASSTSSTTSSTTTPKIISSRTPAITKAPSATSTAHTTRKISTTNTPNFNTITAATTKPAAKPRPNIGASIQATVNMVKSIEKMVGEFARQKLQLISRFLTGKR